LASRSRIAATRSTSSPTAAVPAAAFLPRIYFHEVDVGRYPLFEYPPYDLALAVRMHEVVLTHKLDLLHVHYAIPHATSAWIAREMLVKSRPDIKVLTTLHGTDITIVGQDPSFSRSPSSPSRSRTALTAVSQYLRDETLSAFGCTGCRIEVIRTSSIRSSTIARDTSRSSATWRKGERY
jgi:hypothetical protein